MIGAKINGVIVPIDRCPQNGDIVEILTSSQNRGPSRDWLKIVKTSSAKGKIRQWFKKEKRAENIEMGRAEIEKEIRRLNRTLTEDERDTVVGAVSRRIGIEGVEDFYNTLGYGGLALSHISGKLKEELYKLFPDKEPEEAPPIRVVQKPKNLRSNVGIIVDGERGCLVKFAKCCNPLPGDDIIGFVTRGFGVSVHKKDCPNVLRTKDDAENAARWAEAHWEDEFVSATNENLFEAHLKVFSVNRIGLLADLSSALAEMKVTITGINTAVSNQRDEEATINLTIGCRNVSHFRSIISRLKKIDGVHDVVRGFGR